MGAIGKSVRFSLSSSKIATSSKLASQSSSAQPLRGLQADLHTVGKLCRHFRQLESHTIGSPFVGFLEKTKTFKHFVYPRPTPGASIGISRATSLKTVLHDAIIEHGEEYWFEKLRLAKLLSLAVLRFHATPWLLDSWGSGDVHFFRDDVVSQPGGHFQDPYVNAQLRSGVSDPQIMNPGTSASSLATNETLFSLGVVLIELGYNSPFETLTKGNPAEVSTNSQVKDFIAARRLGRSVHKRFNMTYGRLVEKCLNCNFGVATKLEDVELQRAVVVHVVHELDVCLEQYKAFNSLAPSPFGQQAIGLARSVIA